MDLEELKKLAKAATQGQWWIDSHGHQLVSHDGMKNEIIFTVSDDKPAIRHADTGNLSSWRNDNDASYIAAANPNSILELIERCEKAEHKLNSSSDWGHTYYESMIEAEKERDDLRNKLSEMEKRAPIYQWMTDGDDDGWIDCSRDWFDHIKLLSAHSARIVYALPVPQQVSDEIGVQLYEEMQDAINGYCDAGELPFSVIESWEIIFKHWVKTKDMISEITRACKFGFITDELKMIAEENKCK